MDKITTKEQRFNCSECGNEITVDSSLNVGDYFECEYCGIEYEVVEKLENGEFVVQIVEEEK